MHIEKWRMRHHLRTLNMAIFICILKYPTLIVFQRYDFYHATNHSFITLHKTGRPPVPNSSELKLVKNNISTSPVFIQPILKGIKVNRINLYYIIR